MTDAADKIARTAAAVRAAGIPDGLNRWLGMTPAQLADQNERLQRLLDDARKMKGQPMKAPVAGSKEAQLRDMRSHQIPAAAKPATVKKLAAQIAAAATPQPAATAPAQQETTTMETQTTTAAKAAKKSAAPKKAAAVKTKGKKAAKTASKAKKSTAPKPAAAPKTKPATNGDRVRYDWGAAAEKAKAGKVPPPPDFSAPTHERFRPLLAQVIEAAKAGDVKALRAIEINPASSSPKAVARYRDLCVEAVKAATPA